jgi:hypothetical protein
MAGDFTNIINTQFTNTRNYGLTAFNLAKEYIDNLQNYVTGTITTTVPPIQISKAGSVVIDPTILGLIPSFPNNIPNLPLPPATGDHAFPNAPEYSLPSIPSLTNITVPSFIEGTINPPTSRMPVSNIDVPAQAQLDSGGLSPEDALVAAAKSKLINNIRNGGTMLNPQVEVDILNRDLERQEQALQDQLDKLTAQWAKLGWSVPDGLLAGSYIAVNNEYMNKTLDRSREIAVKQAELEQSGMFKSLELAVSLEGLLIGNLNDYAKRVFETSKATQEITVEIFKERVALYNLNLEAFKTDVETYKISVEAEMTRAEVYKAELAGLQTIALIDEEKVKIYTAQINAIMQRVEIYKTTVQAVAVMYEAEKQKLEGYKLLVDAYTEDINSITEIYKGQLDGFKSYVQAYSASADAQTKLMDIDLKAQVATVDASLKEWEIQLNLIVENTKIKLQALDTVAKTASNLAAGAMAAGHSAVSLQGTAAFEGQS